MSLDKDFFPFDVDAYEATSKAHTRAETAADALEIAVDYLRSREPLPPILADYLADAFEVAAAKADLKQQGDALLEELGLKALNRRPVAVNDWEVAQFVDDPENGDSERKRITAAAKHFGISKTTVRRRMKKGRKALEEHERASQEIEREERENF